VLFVLKNSCCFFFASRHAQVLQAINAKGGCNHDDNKVDQLKAGFKKAHISDMYRLEIGGW